jgi:hypothetical protein
MRERLQIEIQDLTEGEAAAVLEFLQRQQRQKKSRKPSPWPPTFAGIGRSGRSDLGARSEEILRTEFGSK